MDNVHPALTFQQNDGNGLQAIMVKWKNKNSMETLMIVLKKLKQKAVIFRTYFHQYNHVLLKKKLKVLLMTKKNL